MKRVILLILLFALGHQAFSWGFYAHRRINYFAVFLLPPEMMLLYKPALNFLEEHAVDPDKRRYAVAEEGPRHYLDIDKYGVYPYPSLPRKWNEAVKIYTEDSLKAHGIVPWWLSIMLNRLTAAFKAMDHGRILKLSAELGHYIADSHVPLHASSNHNGQYTGQKGIHGFWESRIPELFAEPIITSVLAKKKRKDIKSSGSKRLTNRSEGWDFFIGKANYIPIPSEYIWARVLESALAADSVLKFEKQLSLDWPPEQRFAFEERNGVIIRQYSSSYTAAFDEMLGGMVERRMRQSIYSVASFWYTAWVNAGQPSLAGLAGKQLSTEEINAFEALNNSWKNGKIKDRDHE